MDILDGILVGLLHLITPFAIYLFYVAYKKTYDEKENELIFIITIFTSLYICLKYNTRIALFLPLVSINVPLIISYYKKNNLAIFVCSFIIILYNFKFYGSFLFLIIMEYVLYMVIFKLFKKKSFNYFIFCFCLVKLLFLFSFLFIRGYYLDAYLKVLLMVLIFFVVSILIIYFLKEGENILRIHMVCKEMEQDKQIKNTLFRITHEIKNPIAVCKGYLDMFDVDNKEHARRYIPIIKNEISKTLVLLEDFLSLNRVKIEKDVLDVNMLLEEVIGSFKLYMKEHKIELKSNISSDEVYVDGDYNRLREVFVNIVKNSVEAISDGGVISIWTRVFDDMICIYVKDNGMGMKEEVLKKIYEPFYTTKQKGTGLGVPLSREIILRHGGDIAYESKYGCYTLVSIRLPILKDGC